ncbi:hypothetical protein Tco_0663421 [Tanacetum coccineum]
MEEMVTGMQGDKTGIKRLMQAVNEVNASSKVHEQVSHVKCKTIIQTSNDDQIDSNIIFDDPYVENNGITSEHDSNAHDEYHELQILAYNVQKEAENQKRLNNELKRKKCVESSNSVRRLKSKETKSKNRVLKNTNAKSSTAHVRNMSRSDSIDSNKRETNNSNIRFSVCVSCGKDVFLLSHEKYVAHYSLSRSSSVKRALFTTLIAAKSKNLGATSIVVKSRLSVAKTPTEKNTVSSVLPLSPDSSQSRTLSDPNLRFRNDHFAAITSYGDYVQGNLTICHVYYVEGLGHNLFSVGQFCDGDLKVAFRSNTLCLKFRRPHPTTSWFLGTTAF